MSKFTQLQASAALQLIAEDDLASKFSAGARQFSVVAALVVASAIATPASGQNSPLTPSACASFGSGIGAILGGIAGGNTWEKRALGAAIGTFGGAVAGNMACAPSEEQAAAKQQHQQRHVTTPAQINPVAQAAMNGRNVSRGTAHAPVGVQPGQYGYTPDNTNYFAPAPASSAQAQLIPVTAPARAPSMAQATVAADVFRAQAGAMNFEPVSLSTAEARRLELWSREVIEKKVAFKTALQNLERGAATKDDVEHARTAFEEDRKAYGLVVYRLTLGSDKPNVSEVSPRNVSRHLEVAAALMDVPTARGVTWKQVATADLNLEVQNPEYGAALNQNRAAARAK